MAKSQPALLGTQVSGLVLARARGRPGPGLAQSQPALLGTQGSWPNWPKVNRPCWALKGLGPKSTGPVGHSGVLAQSQPALLGTQGSWPNWPKVNRPCWALKGRPKVNRPCWALKGLGPQVDRPCWALKGLGPKSTGPVGHSRVLAQLAQSQQALLGTQGSWPKVNRPCWALKGLGPQVDRPCWALKGLGPTGPKSSGPAGHSACPGLVLPNSTSTVGHSTPNGQEPGIFPCRGWFSGAQVGSRVGWGMDRKLALLGTLKGLGSSWSLACWGRLTLGQLSISRCTASLNEN